MTCLTKAWTNAVVSPVTNRYIITEYVYGEQMRKFMYIGYEHFDGTNFGFSQHAGKRISAFYSQCPF